MKGSELEMAIEQFYTELVQLLGPTAKIKDWADIQERLESLVLLTKHCRQLDNTQRPATRPEPGLRLLPKVKAVELVAGR